MSKRLGKGDSCETVQARYTVYPVPEAAALWCGVPPEEVRQELRVAVPVGESDAMSRTVLRHPYLPCLELRIRAVQLAIDPGELAASGRTGGGSKRVSMSLMSVGTWTG